MAAGGPPGYAGLLIVLLGGAMMPAPGDEKAAAAAARGGLRASQVAREQTIDVLKTAFVQGRLTMDEFDARVDQALACRTYAELVTVIADLPAGLTGARPARGPGRRRATNAIRWGASGLVTPVILVIAFVFSSLRGDGGYEAVAFMLAFAYFVFWLSVGTDMLWQWHCMSVPTARMCVRCAHTAAAHPVPGSCTVRPGTLKPWRRCSCAGFVPPGRSPEAADGHHGELVAIGG
jgi:Domain of unknown function (DUF1707)